MRWLLAASAVGMLAVMAWRRIVRTRGAPLRVRRSTGIVAHEPAAVPHAARFNAHLLFAQGAGSHIIIDGLAEAAGRQGAVVGVPFSLVLSRPSSSLAEELLLAVIGQWSEECQVELGLTDGVSSVRVLTAQGELAIEVESASGLPYP
jgi:hypothetical protein